MLLAGNHVLPFSCSEELLAVGIRTHGRGTFFVYSNKESTQRLILLGTKLNSWLFSWPERQSTGRAL